MYKDNYKFDLEKLYGFFNQTNHNWLELSRAENILRGVGLLVGGGAGIALLVVGSIFLSTVFPRYPLACLLFFLGYSFPCVLLFLLLKMDLCSPADEPVRFNRITRKVYVYHYHRSWNPFKKWYVEIKCFNWDDIRAEITTQGGMVGYGYISRVNLICSVYDPDTNEVIDRFPLAGNLPHGMATGLPELWRYCCVFMNEPELRLPRPKLRDGEPTLNNSLKGFLPLLMYGEQGREARRDMDGVAWVISLIGLVILPVTLLFILCHYFVMRRAAEVVWPKDIDLESRTAS